MLKSIKNKYRKINIKNIRISYYVRNGDGTGTRMSFSTNVEQEQLEEDLESFYIQADDMSTIEVEQMKQERKRERRDNEDCYITEFKKERSITKSFYMEYFTNKSAKEFLKKRNFIRLLYGSLTCVNLVNQGRYFCHVPSCPNPGVSLKVFNDLGAVIKHWSLHSLGESKIYSKDESCAQLLRRNDYAKKMKDGDLAEMIDELEAAQDKSGTSLGIETLLINKNIVFSGSKFPDADMVVDDEVLKSMLRGDENALDSVPEKGSKIDFFKARLAKSKK